MKVYAVWAWNREDYEDSYTWLINVFATRKSAEKYIQNIQKHYEEDYARVKELRNLKKLRGLDGAEERELTELNERWCGYDSYRTPECWIKEYKVHE